MKTRGCKGLWALIATIALAGCSDLGAPLRLLPRAEVSVASVDFGTVVVNGVATREVVVRNTGTAPLSGVAAVSCPGYSIQSGGGAFTLAPGEQRAVVVRFQPGAVGAAPCELQLGDGIPPVPLNGAGALQASGAACAVSVAALEFGSVALGASKLAVFKVFSTGSAPVILDVVSSCGEFAIVGGGGPRSLAPGDSLVVTVGFTPSAGGHAACVVATGPGCPDVAVSGDATSVSFAQDIAPILANRGCVGCHGWNTADQFVNVTTAAYAPAVYIRPFDLGGSVLYGKITNSGQYGEAMPQAAPLMPLAERNKFRDWILEGATNN